MANGDDYLVQICSPGPPAFLTGKRRKPFDPSADGVRLTFYPHRALRFSLAEASDIASYHSAYSAIRVNEIDEFVGHSNCANRETWTRAVRTNCIVRKMLQWGSEKIEYDRGIGLPGIPVDIAMATNGSVAFRWDAAWAIGIWENSADDLRTTRHGVYEEAGYEEEGGYEFDFHADKPNNQDWAYTILSRGRMYASLASGLFVPQNILSDEDV
jgi:hypothetical protein